MVSKDRYPASSRTGLYVRMNAYRQRVASGRRAAASNSASQTGSMLGRSVIVTRQWYHSRPACQPVRSISFIEVCHVLLQARPAGRGQLIPGDRPPAAVALFYRQKAGILELAQVRAEAAIGLAQHLLEPAERHRAVLREQDAHREPHAVLQQTVERRQLVEAGDVRVNAQGHASVLQETPGPSTPPPRRRRPRSSRTRARTA